jgi:hypothetical protein
MTATLASTLIIEASLPWHSEGLRHIARYLDSDQASIAWVSNEGETNGLHHLYRVTWGSRRRGPPKQFPDGRDKLTIALIAADRTSDLSVIAK